MKTYNGNRQGCGFEALDDFAELIGMDAEVGEGVWLGELGVGFGA